MFERIVRNNPDDRQGGIPLCFPSVRWQCSTWNCEFEFQMCANVRMDSQGLFTKPSLVVDGAQAVMRRSTHPICEIPHMLVADPKDKLTSNIREGVSKCPICDWFEGLDNERIV